MLLCGRYVALKHAALANIVAGRSAQCTQIYTCTVCSIVIFQMRELPRYIFALPATMLITDTVRVLTALHISAPRTTNTRELSKLMILSMF